jgi:hypothetical protein
MGFDYLSPELVHTILQLLHRKDLRSVSLVCRAWGFIALPLLYHTVDLTRGRNDQYRAQRFFQYIIDKPDMSEGGCEYGPRFFTYVRRLHLGVYMSDKELVNFERAISKMSRLNHLDWDLTYLDHEGHSILLTLERSLPQLHTLHLIMTGNKFKLVCVICQFQFSTHFHAIDN